MEILNELSLVTNTDKLVYMNYDMPDKNTFMMKVEQANFNNYEDIEDDTTVDKALFEVINKTAVDSGITWKRTLPPETSKFEHYQTFKDMLVELSARIYAETKRFVGNKFIISANLVPVVKFLDCFISEPITAIYGTYKLGKIDSAFLKTDIYVSPYLNSNEVICTCVADDKMTAGLAASIVDNKYSIKVLNDKLLVKGVVVD